MLSKYEILIHKTVFCWFNTNSCTLHQIIAQHVQQNVQTPVFIIRQSTHEPAWALKDLFVFILSALVLLYAVWYEPLTNMGEYNCLSPKLPPSVIPIVVYLIVRVGGVLLVCWCFDCLYIPVECFCCVADCFGVCLFCCCCLFLLLKRGGGVWY